MSDYEPRSNWKRLAKWFRHRQTDPQIRLAHHEAEGRLLRHRLIPRSSAVIPETAESPRGACPRCVAPCQSRLGWAGPSG